MARRKTIAKPEAKPEVEKVDQVTVTSKLYISNPYTKQRFLSGEATKVVLDSWVESQIEAGLLVVS